MFYFMYLFIYLLIIDQTEWIVLDSVIPGQKKKKKKVNIDTVPLQQPPGLSYRKVNWI